ncbi:MAG: 50S ribosomal protein L11 methyltransferase [Oscillospiraceae bacterium]|nr:50S ribosomal protein L11 methyltransferase [Oscillospiraceae bacterium]
MTWLEITINTTGADLETLAARLAANGADELVIEDEADFRRFLEENRQYWDYVDDGLLRRMEGAARIKFYVTDDAGGRAQLARYTAGLEGYEVLSAPLREEDWATSWQKYYKPLAVGRRLYIVPEWERGGEAPAGCVPVILNPGLSFGTGSHASTQLCLEELEDVVTPGDRALDLGCGSGILSIAALLLGCAGADAVDIDPEAVTAGEEHAALAGLGPGRLCPRCGDVLTDEALVDWLDSREPYQLILANIVADVILPLAPLARRRLAPGGYFLCSGVIEPRRDEVCAGLEAAGFSVLKRRERSGWCALLCGVALKPSVQNQAGHQPCSS